MSSDLASRPSGLDITHLFSRACRNPGDPLGQSEAWNNPSVNQALIQAATELQAFKLLNLVMGQESSLEIEEKARREAFVSTIVDEQTHRVLYLLQHRGIPIICAGDPVARARMGLAEKAIRPLRRSEFLVGLENWTEVIRTLTDQGFEIENQPGDSLALHFRKGPPVVLSHSIGSAVSAEQIERIWSRVETGKVAGLPLSAHTLSSIDQLLKIILRAEFSWQNPFSGRLDLWALYDADHIVRFQPLDWDELIWELSERRILSLGWFALNLISSSWQSPVPKEVLRDLSALVNPRRKRALGSLLSVESWLNRHLFSWTEPLIRIEQGDGWYERVATHLTPVSSRISRIKRSSAARTPRLLLGGSPDSTKQSAPSLDR